MEKIVFVTGNKGKYLSMKERCNKKGIDLIWEKIDLNELEVNDITMISKDKARQAYSILSKPCFVIDSGFFIDNYPGNPGYPGAFVKRSGITDNILGLLNVMKNVEDRTCKFVDALTFYDGEEFYIFYDINLGYLSKEVKGDNMNNAKSNLWKLFIPQGYIKTVAEMSDEEFGNYISSKVSIKDKFLEWYINDYENVKRLSKI